MPVSDDIRLRALTDASLLDTPAERVFDRLTELAAVTLDVPIALISLVTDDRQFFKSQCGLPSPVAEERETPLSHSFCQHVVQDRAPLVISDARMEPRLQSNLAIPDLGVVAYAGVPLITATGAVLGSFCAIDRQPRDWAPEEIAFLTTLAEATMDIVTLRSEALAAAEVGRRLQAALVPTPPNLARADVVTLYRPGEQRLLLGGDFYLCAETRDGSMSVLIGDVAGHGPEAAAFATSLRSAWRALLLSRAPLADLVAGLNAVALAEQPSPAVFATALACTIPVGVDAITVCSAGHPPPVLIAEGGARELAAPAGPPLGVLAGEHWATRTSPLPVGASVLLYTDGLIEGRAAPATARRLGIEAIMTEIDHRRTTIDLLEALADLATRANGAPLSDDVAALLLSPHPA